MTSGRRFQIAFFLNHNGGFIGVVRKTFRLRIVFLLQTLMPPSYLRNIIMTSGIKYPHAVEYAPAQSQKKEGG